MKKRWGKPITQVQRFVPQEFAALCQEPKYKLYAITDISNRSNIRLDWGGDGYLDGDDQNWYATRNIQYSAFTTEQLSTMMITANMWLKGTGNEVNYGNNKTKYDGSTGVTYTPYKPPYPLYKFGGNKAYKAEKVSS